MKATKVMIALLAGVLLCAFSVQAGDAAAKADKAASQKAAPAEKPTCQKAAPAEKPTCQKADLKGEEVCCPVEGKCMPKAAATVKTKYKGKTYYFCCEGCLAKFNKEPDKYIAALKKSCADKVKPVGQEKKEK